jgi:tripartite-type tricarboxylate transporter receptor subunit TctC
MQARRALLGSLAALVALGLAPPAQSQGWPQRPVKIIVPFAAGGNGDIIARVVAHPLGEALGQPFVVEARPGAGGAIAAEAVARAPADGYTLFMGNTPVISIAPAAGKTPYDPVTDFAPISTVGTNPLILVVHPGIPANTLAEFVDYARRQPNKLTYAASGAGTLIYLSTALFLKRAGIDMIPVNYRGGGAPPLADVIAGHVNAYFCKFVRRVAAGGERHSPAACDIERTACPTTPRYSDVHRIRVPGLQDPYLERSDGARGDTEGDHR